MASRGFRCSVPGCFSVSSKCPGLTFHLFPKDRIEKRKWIVRIDRDDGECFQVQDWSVICSRHFLDEDYVTIRGGSCSSLTCRGLKKGAVPSLFPWNNYTSTARRRKPAKDRKPLTFMQNIDNMKGLTYAIDSLRHTLMETCTKKQTEI